MLIVPAPWHFSHRPPLTLKENLPGLYPFALASGSCAKRVRMGPKRPTYVAGFERGVRPMGLWSMLMILSISPAPRGRVGPLRKARPVRRGWKAPGKSRSDRSVDFPDGKPGDGRQGAQRE